MKTWLGALALFVLAALLGVLAVGLFREGGQRNTLIAGASVVGCFSFSFLGVVAIIAGRYYRNNPAGTRRG